VLDPVMGSGTTLVQGNEMGMHTVGIDISPFNCLIARVKVAEEFWDFIGGENTYDELLDIFENVGVQLRPEIDAGFARFAPK